MPETNPLIHWIAQRIHRNKNAIIIINGSTGSGKTYAGIDLALRISKLLGTKFTVRENLDFSFIGLKKKMILPFNKGKGIPFLLEEVGAMGGGGASREWQSKANSFFFSFMQTGRALNQIVIMTCPQFAYLDKGVRQMCHIQITMTGINHKTMQSYGKPFIVQTNSISGKMYFKYLRYKTKGSRTALTTSKFYLPPREMIDEYEKIKQNFLNDLDKSIIKSAEPKKKGLPNGRKPVTPKQVMEYRKKGLSNREIANMFGVSLATVTNRIRYLKKGGI